MLQNKVISSIPTRFQIYQNPRKCEGKGKKPAINYVTVYSPYFGLSFCQAPTQC